MRSSVFLCDDASQDGLHGRLCGSLFRGTVDKSQDELQWQRCLHELVPTFQGSCGQVSG